MVRTGGGPEKKRRLGVEVTKVLGLVGRRVENGLEVGRKGV